MDAPEVDGKVHLSDDFDAEPGYLMWVQIMHAMNMMFGMFA
ncbi:MAG: hypothetical protein QNK36_12010 [Colwellia sp.]|nr:hypothetical protein [Colwellia sp.]